MKNKSRVVMFISIISLPALFAFQNCSPKANQDSTTFEGSSTFQTNHSNISFDTSTLGKNGSVSLDQTSGEDDRLSQRVTIQIEDPEQQFLSDIASAPEKCEADRHEPATTEGYIAVDGSSVSKIRGVVVLSPEDFDGRTHIEKISDVFGTIILCNLTVDTIESTRGRIILSDSNVGSIVNHSGQVGIFGNSHSIITNSNVQVREYSP